MLADIGKDKVCGDGRDLVKARLAELSLDVIFGSETEATMGLYAGVRCLPRGFCCQVFRHVGFGAAGFAGVVEFASAKAHQARCFGLNVARCDRELYALVLTNRPVKNAPFRRILCGARVDDAQDEGRILRLGFRVISVQKRWSDQRSIEQPPSQNAP